MGIYGVPPGMWSATQTGQREALRGFIASSVRPVVDPLVRRMAMAVGADVPVVTWRVVQRADVPPLARALEGLVRAGVPLDQARSICDL